MKTTEEKAKAYDKAVKAIDALCNGWDNAELRKELEKLFPELKESEDERIRKELINYFKKLLIETSKKEFNDLINKDFKKYIVWLEKQAEKQNTIEWSEEDERQWENLRCFLSEYGYRYYGEIALEQAKSWLKSLRHRPKQEWSEEDEKIRQTIIREFEQCSEWYCANGLTKEDCIAWLNKQKNIEWTEENEIMIDTLHLYLDQMYSSKMIGDKDAAKAKVWLKSLHPQKHWKPTEEQLDALKVAIAYMCDESETPTAPKVLTELLEQLKQL